MLDLFKQYDELQKKNVLFFFKGEVSFDLVQSVLDIMEFRLEYVENNLKTKKKVFNVLVEVLQNLSHHIEYSRSGNQEKSAIFKVWTDANNYYITTGNLMPSKNVNELEARLVQINSIDEVELRTLFKEKLNDKFTEKGGGGLGFIDIARKSGQKLKYNFDEIDGENSFFSFQINIPKENNLE